MICTQSLIRVAGRVNLRIHRGSRLSNDHLLRVELFKEGGLMDELGAAHLGAGCWFWAPFIGVNLIQYDSGRCAVIESSRPAYDGIPLEEAIA